jgi:hypothetical protein
MSGWSPASSPRKALNSLLSPFKRTLDRTESQGSIASETATTPKSGGGSIFGGLVSAQRKREIIKRQQEENDLLKYECQHKGQEVQRLQQQCDAEKAEAGALKQRLNMQFFKANLLVDMLVLRLIDTSSGKAAGAAPPPAAGPATIKAAPAPAAVAVAAAVAEDSEFD